MNKANLWAISFSIVCSAQVAFANEKLQTRHSAVASPHSPARSQDTATDKAILVRFSHIRGTTKEHYSDGLRVRVDRHGNRIERLRREDSQFAALPPDTFGQAGEVENDYFINTVLTLSAPPNSRKSSSAEQSRLYQYAKYYADLGELNKARDLYEKYFAVFREIHADGTAVTTAETEQREVLRLSLTTAIELAKSKDEKLPGSNERIDQSQTPCFTATLQNPGYKRILEDQWHHPKYDTIKRQLSDQSASFVVFVDNSGCLIESKIRKSCGDPADDLKIVELLEKPLAAAADHEFRFGQTAYLFCFPEMKIEKLDDLSF